MTTAFDDLYDRDFYLWAKSQADALRARGRGDNAIDYDRLAEEVEDLGKSEYRAVRSLTVRIIEHLFKLSWTRFGEPKNGWRAEIVRFRDDAVAALTPTIRRMIVDDLEKLHQTAAKVAGIQFKEQEPDASCDISLRWTLEEILGEQNDPIERMSGA